MPLRLSTVIKLHAVNSISAWHRNSNCILKSTLVEGLEKSIYPSKNPAQQLQNVTIFYWYILQQASCCIICLKREGQTCQCNFQRLTQRKDTSKIIPTRASYIHKYLYMNLQGRLKIGSNNHELEKLRFIQNQPTSQSKVRICFYFVRVTLHSFLCTMILQNLELQCVEKDRC